MDKQKINDFYNRNYKKSLIIPILFLILALAYMGYFYSQNQDFIHRDLSLTGGTTITVFSNASNIELQKALSVSIPDVETSFLKDSSGKQNQIIILTSEKPEKIIPLIENYLGFKLDEKNSSIEFTGSSLSDNFYKQLGITVLIAFFWMAGVVFIIFAPKWKIKTLAIILNLAFGIFIGKILFKLSPIVGIIIALIFIFVLLFLYIKYSIPSFAVMFCAFADIILTLAVVDFLGMKIAAAGIVAFLMLIGYSVDTDILLTTRVMTRKENSVNREIFGAFKTGITMTLTAIAAVAVALVIVHPFGTVLNQMFEILLIGLTWDIMNTWITNTALIKWFVEHKSVEKHETHL